MKKWLEPIERMGACEEALVWADHYKSFAEAWEECERGDWMLWLLGRLSGEQETDSRRKLVLVTCQCARLALPYVIRDDKRPLKAIKTAEAWARGKVSLEDVRKAAFASDAAFAASDATYAAAAAYYTADTPYIAYIAAIAASDAAYTFTDRIKILKKCADIVRAEYPSISLDKGKDSDE
jgi:hypothetical protein